MKVGYSKNQLFCACLDGPMYTGMKPTGDITSKNEGGKHGQTCGCLGYYPAKVCIF